MPQYNDFLGEGGTGVAPSKPYDPDDEPNPANPGGVSNNRLRAQQAQNPYRSENLAASGRQNLLNSGAKTATTAPGQWGVNQYTDPKAFAAPVDNSFKGVGLRGVKTAGDIAGAVAGAVPAAASVLNPGFVGSAVLSGMAVQRTANAAASKLGATPAAAGAGAGGPTRPQFDVPGAAPGGVPGVTPPAAPGAGPAPGAPAPAAAPAWSPVSADVSSYDAGTAAIQQAQSVFQSELTRLSGVDPFGNQAFMQKATDRAVAQAAGTAAGARGGAAAQAGALRGQQGVQSQLASRGIQDLAQQRTTDQNAAGQQRLQAAGGIMSGATAIAENEGKKADAYLKASEQNLRGYLGGRELDQAEAASLRNVAVEIAKIDQQMYATNVGYRESVNANLTSMYSADTALQGLKYSTDAGENLSADEWLMGLMGAGSGLAMKSDRRSKYAIRSAKLAEMKEYLGSTKGSHYRYRSPNAPGQRSGDNYGPIAQDLQRTKIGRTVVEERSDGLYVNTGRLALADHGALAHLAARVERLAARLGKKDRK